MTDRPPTGPREKTSYGIAPEDWSPERWEECKRFVDFTEEDAKRLRTALARFESAIDGTVDRFYDHLLAIPATRAVLEHADVADHLKRQQRQYLKGLGGGRYGEAYLRERIRIGLMHERIGLEPRWYLGAYWLYLRDLVPRLVPSAPPEEQGLLLSLLKILLLDMILVTESYTGRALGLVREQKDRLEQIVHERTRLLSKWERLAAVGSMAAKVAHEIRNPLSSITLNTELLSDELEGYRGADTREARDLLRAIAGELDRLSRIVEEYLQFARMPRLELEQVDVREISEQVVKFLAPEFERLNVGIELDVAEGLPSLYLDRNQFRQVLLNLLRNSQEAMPDGGKITIRVREEPDGAVEVVILDTGVGIEPTHLQKVFDPFYSTKDTGTGLGLAFVQQVVLEHGGEVACTSQAGRGAAFRILLPERLRVRPQAPQAPPAAAGA